MFTFFRKLRNSFLISGQTRKYVAHAIGEILLVMIGILLALQVNNWNEGRKVKQTEQDILQELEENLVLNIESLHSSIDRKKSMNYSKGKIIEALENRLPYYDSLGVHFLFGAVDDTESTLSFAGYEMLKNRGYEMLSSKELRKSVVQLFEITYVHFENRESRSSIEYLIEDLTRYFRAHFRRLSNPFRREPLDYPALFEDNYFIESLKAAVYYESYLIKLSESTIDSSEQVLELIQDELAEDGSR